MSQPNSSHFHNGKAARAAGKPCVISDGRMTNASRQEWYDGWNFQDALMRPVPSAEEIEDTASFLRDLKQSVKEGSL
jgi:hypothetical protein